jgi:hypothetical protein
MDTVIDYRYAYALKVLFEKQTRFDEINCLDNLMKNANVAERYLITVNYQYMYKGVLYTKEWDGEKVEKPEEKISFFQDMVFQFWKEEFYKLKKRYKARKSIDKNADSAHGENPR